MEGHRYADDTEPSWHYGRHPYGPDDSGSHAVGSPYDSGVHERPRNAFRLPEQRPSVPTSPHPALDAPATGGLRIPVRGPEYPTIRPVTDRPPADHRPPADRLPANRPSAEEQPAERQLVDRLPTERLPTERPPADRLPTERSPADRLPTERLPADRLPTERLPTERLPTDRPARASDSVYQTRRPVSSFLVAVVMAVLMIPVVRLLIDATFAGAPTARAIVPAVLLTLGFALTGVGLFAIARGGPIGREAWSRPPVAYLPAGLLLLLAAGLAVA